MLVIEFCNAVSVALLYNKHKILGMNNEMGISSLRLGGCPDVADRATLLGTIYTYIHTYTYIDMYIYIYVYMYVYI